METVTQQIGAFVRDNGGNAWDALNVALARLDLATARAEAAEAEAAHWRELHDDRDHDLQHEYARAEAAEAECERLLEFQRECLLPHEANDLGNDLDEAKAECERLREALADCQRERTRNVDAAARAIDELAANSGQDAH